MSRRRRRRCQVYLLHFSKRYEGGRGPQHYIGSAYDVEARLAQHSDPSRCDVRLLRAALAQGITFEVVRTWDRVKWDLEHQLKRQGNAGALCPKCRRAFLDHKNELARKRKEKRDARLR